MFRVGVTRDFLKPDGSPGFGDIGLSLLDAAGVAWEYLPAVAGELPPEVARDYDGLLVLGAEGDRGHARRRRPAEGRRPVRRRVRQRRRAGLHRRRACC